MDNSSQDLQQGTVEGSVQDTAARIHEQLAEHAVILYMKGSPKLPSCGFSAQASQALMSCGKPFAYVDVLQNPDIRAELPKIANWPTFPQLWVKGELIGGCDIILEMYQQGELQTIISEAVPEEPKAE
ncbi:MAG: Grx4 family monothiol glutaredoxin [Idiomarina sp.]|nr:Grx4 family monothiol glutaredoxin [Idiomarina sp.]